MDSPTASAPTPRVKSSPLPAGWGIWLAGLVALYVALLLLTRPADYMDSLSYAKHVADQYSHDLNPGTNPFFDFGHVLWKPLVYVFWLPFRAPLHAAFAGDDILAAASVEIALNIAGGLLGAVFMFLLAARTTRSAAVAGITSIGYISTNALMFYLDNGMTYALGISCQVIAIYVLQGSLSKGRFRFIEGALSGLLLGCSIVIWFPYVLSAAGIFSYAMLIQDSDEAPEIRQRVAGLTGLVAATAAVTLAVYGSVMFVAHFTSLHALGEWIARSRYDKQPDRQLLRMFGGIPRGMFSLGDFNVIAKRILFEHSFSLVTLVQAGIWKILLVYAVLATAVVSLWRSAGGRRLLVCLAAIAVPLLFFAAFLFDATSPERYLAAFPLLFLGFGRILSDRRSGLFARGLVGLFFACMLVANAGTYQRFQTPRGFDTARIRVEAINGKIQSQDRVVLLSPRDEVLNVVNSQPFSPLSKNRYSYFSGLPWLSAHKERWRINFAESTQQTWDRGGKVWLSVRFLAAHPDPAWGWVEGDLPGIAWNDLPAFFGKLELTNSFAGPDGFGEVARTPANESLLRAVIAGTVP